MVPLPRLVTAALVYRGRLAPQCMNFDLYDSEQLYLGDMDTVCGLRSGYIAGDRGLYARNELAWVDTPERKDGRIEPMCSPTWEDASLRHRAFRGWSAPVQGARGMVVEQAGAVRQLLVGQALAQPAALGPKATLVLGTRNMDHVAP